MIHSRQLFVIPSAGTPVLREYRTLARMALAHPPMGLGRVRVRVSGVGKRLMPRSYSFLHEDATSHHRPVVEAAVAVAVGADDGPLCKVQNPVHLGPVCKARKRARVSSAKKRHPARQTTRPRRTRTTA
jgi:hypothetical protein